MPSIREGLGLSGIEMLCEGIPLVGSDVQGIREYIINGETGYLCSPYDVDAFAKGLEKLSDPQARLKMKDQCKNIVKMFDTEVSVKQRKEIYNQILN